MNAAPEAEPPTDAEVACFETGIKFGSLYHQFAGTPVSPASAESLARAIEEATENQPYCRRASVSMDTDAIAADADEEYGYTELTGRFLDVALDIEYEGIVVRGRMAMRDGYPHMDVISVDRDGASSLRDR